MLTITIPETECFDDRTQTFIHTKETTLQLEHSLVSLSKWESKWHKPLFFTDNMSYEEQIDYVRCMTKTQNVDPLVYRVITMDVLKKIKAYIDDPMTATVIHNVGDRHGNSREVFTSEVIYGWMVSLGIPPQFEKWHLNRLLTLIRVCNHMNSPSKKLGRKEQMAQQRALNAARRKQLNTHG